MDADGKGRQAPNLRAFGLPLLRAGTLLSGDLLALLLRETSRDLGVFTLELRALESKRKEGMFLIPFRRIAAGR